jgi:hypothetical protein
MGGWTLFAWLLLAGRFLLGFFLPTLGAGVFLLLDLVDARAGPIAVAA